MVLIHEGTALGSDAVDGTAADPWQGPIVDIANGIQDTTVDAIIAGHTHRVSNLMVGNILVTEGINAGASYSVVQMVVKGRDVEWAGGATRIAKNIGVAADPTVQAIVDDANAQTAVLRNQVIGTQSIDIKRAPDRLAESAMGNIVADAMRLKYPGVDAAYTNSGGLRVDLLVTPPTAGEAPGEITWGEMFSVLPFGNRTTILTLTGAQLEQAFLNGFSPKCDPSINTGRFPQISGLKVSYTCNGTTPVSHGDVEGAGRCRRDADADRPDRHCSLRDQRLHVHRRRRLHRLRAGHRCTAARRRPVAGRDRLRHRQLAGSPSRRRKNHSSLTVRLGRRRSSGRETWAWHRLP